ncbi:hypothetical protein H310_04395 [Aphanomyces invadans]|uniref:START domain-containing protein n=1 Tax=Aphanomyces invadans TaxID=157072 RepID=A0A024UCR3_9STRA|nr:hypothetical protein H310_04395 [Aphanomyces invadans]ETW03990.1 hypothetical protein H310_04395 [Aphanomyces invadans]|eukprot:XP_008866946.1 hypothetical protein H310_04395 [Aphanomyces invadans]
MHKPEARAFAETLSDEDVEYLKQVARKTCARVASASRMDASSSVTWEPIGHKDGVDIYIGEANEASESRKVKTTSSMRKYLCGVTYVPASIDDVVDIFHSKPSLQKMKNDGSKTSFNAFEREILNTKTLYKIRKRTSSAPRHCISLKWMRLGSTIKEMDDRDFVFLECQDTIFDEKVKRRGWVCSMHSVQLPGCPPLDGYVRGSLYRSGYVFRETEAPNVLQVVCIMDMDFKGEMNANLTNLMLKSRVMIAGSIREHFQARQDELNESHEEQDAVPCPLCRDYLASTPCITCNHVVCMNCCQLVDAENSVCTVCIMNGKVDQIMTNQANDCDSFSDKSIGGINDASILLPPSSSNTKQFSSTTKPAIVLATLPDLDEDEDVESSTSTDQQRLSSEDNNQGVEGYTLKLQPPGFFAQLLVAPHSSARRRREDIDTVKYVEPDGKDPLYALAVQRLQVAASPEQESTRLAIVNLCYKHVLEC